MQIVFNHVQHLPNNTIHFNQRLVMSGRLKQPANACNYFIGAVALVYRGR